MLSGHHRQQERQRPRRRHVVAAAALLAAAARVGAYPNGAPPVRTNAPGEATCASAATCHDTVLNDPAGQVILTLGDATGLLTAAGYQPGVTYTLDVGVSSGRTDRRRWGFEITILDDGGVRAGTMPASADPAYQVLFEPTFARQYATHAIAGSAGGSTTGTTWHVVWTAPPSDVGPLTLYACANAANDDGNRTGDYIGCRTFRIPTAGGSVELRVDASTIALTGGGAAACGPATTPPLAETLLTSCPAPRTTGCDPAAAVPPTRTAMLTPGVAGPDLVLPGEADAAFEAGVLAAYELDGCGLELLLAKSGMDLLVDTR